MAGRTDLAWRRERRAAAQRHAALGYLAAWAIPIALWHDHVSDVASGFRLEPLYIVTGWAPWALLACGMLLLLPVAASAGRAPGSPRYPRARNAYAGWGVTLYLLGLALALQIAITGSVG